MRIYLAAPLLIVALTACGKKDDAGTASVKVITPPNTAAPATSTATAPSTTDNTTATAAAGTANNATAGTSPSTTSPTTTASSDTTSGTSSGTSGSPATTEGTSATGKTGTATAGSGDQSTATVNSPTSGTATASTGGQSSGAGGSASAAAGGKGEETYNKVCMACHAAGVAGAPKITDAADWKARAAQGKNTLYEHAIKGFQGKKGVMPPKGGNTSLSDDDVKAAVDYMVATASK